MDISDYYLSFRKNLHPAIYSLMCMFIGVLDIVFSNSIVSIKSMKVFSCGVKNPLFD